MSMIDMFSKLKRTALRRFEYLSDFSMAAISEAALC